MRFDLAIRAIVCIQFLLYFTNFNDSYSSLSLSLSEFHYTFKNVEKYITSNIMKNIFELLIHE